MIGFLDRRRLHTGENEEAPHLFAYRAQDFHLIPGMLVRSPVLYVDHTDDAVARDHGSRKESLEGVLRQNAEVLETRVFVCFP